MRLEREQKRITILGSTGSVGVNTLDIVRRNPDMFDVVVLTAGQNVDLLIEQALEFKPEQAVIADSSLYDHLKAGLAGTGISVSAGEDALIEVAQQPVDLVMAAIVGAAGLAPTLRAVEHSHIIALANKECLVSAGRLFMDTVRLHGAQLLPVDSEHSAIFQVLDTKQADALDRIILTASGGPFREWSFEQLSTATPDQAVAHPNWSMGAKISVDSATMMNKGLELIEAQYLFDVAESHIEIVVHPQSIVHSLVSYVDGSVLAQLGTPDMRTPIAYALGWPERISVPMERLNLSDIAQLTFEAPDFKRFPALVLARQALQSGGGAPTILNAANEVAVARFLAGEIKFLDIIQVVEKTLERCESADPSSLAEVMLLDEEARRLAQGCNLLKTAAA
ncbi:MAG: 1-deoxy-D-xylulose-5-phosphate reductoisomerase [Rhodospirillaceae bacterium]